MGCGRVLGGHPGGIAVCSWRRVLPPPHLPFALSLHRRRRPSASTHPSFPLVGCANGAPGVSLSPHRGGQRLSPFASCVQADTPYRRWGNTPKQRMSTCGVTSPTRAHTNPQPARSRSRTQCSLWQAHHVSPTSQLSPLGSWCVYGASISCGVGATWCDVGGWCGSRVMGGDR